MIFCGVFRSLKSGILSTTPSTAINAATISENISTVEMHVLTFDLFPAPQYFAISTDVPMPVPVATAIMTIVTAKETPTAARASSPFILPTIMVSMVL